ncbi:MAG: flagellar motor protein MotB [Nitrosomonas sp.]|nr:flagellar motor protein MotB [Nitrosomonas sp.]
MSEDLSQRPIVIKRVKKVIGGHHGGAWKIAYADFVMAMMAFFLLMWLLGSTTQGDLEGIADYFRTPLKVALAGGSGSGDSSSVIQGGGEDLTRRAGQIKKGDVDEKRNIINLEAARAERERRELISLNKLKDKIEKAIEANPALKKFKNQLLLDITTDGLRIQIVDIKNRPMFTSGSADLQSYTQVILRDIGKTLNDVPNRINLTGHTDATPYTSGDKSYSNWELSADRANASRRELIAGGMNPEKVLRVVGLSSAVLFDKNDPFNPMNRRISIIVMNEKAEQAIIKDSQGMTIDKQDQLSKDSLGDANAVSN